MNLGREPLLGRIEEGLLARIREVTAQPEFPYRIKSIESYGGQLDEELAEVVRNFPAVWLTFAAAGKPTRVSLKRAKWRQPLTFALMVGAYNVRGEAATRHGFSVDGVITDPGSYSMLEDVRAIVLTGGDYGLDIEPFEPGAVRTIHSTRLNKNAVSAYAQELHTAVVIERPDAAANGDGYDGYPWLRVGLSLVGRSGAVLASDEVELVAPERMVGNL